MGVVLDVYGWMKNDGRGLGVVLDDYGWMKNDGRGRRKIDEGREREIKITKTKIVLSID